MRGLRNALAVTLVAAGASGCLLSIESDSRWGHGGVTMASLDTVHSGVTTRQWIIEHLGNPDSSTVNADGNEVLRYVARRKTDADVTLFLLFSIDVSDEEIYTVHIEIEDDVVRARWVAEQ